MNQISLMNQQDQQQSQISKTQYDRFGDLVNDVVKEGHCKIQRVNKGNVNVIKILSGAAISQTKISDAIRKARAAAVERRNQEDKAKYFRLHL